MSLESSFEGVSTCGSCPQILIPGERLAATRERALSAQREVRRVETRRRRRARRSVVWRHRRLVYVTTLLIVTGMTGMAAVFAKVRLPEIAPLDETTYVCSAEVASDCGPTNSMAQLAAEQDRQVLSFSEIPPLLISAVLAAEDRDYYRHPGIDPTAVGRALVTDLRGSESLQGGSTITQQYVKNVYTDSERTIMRKLREAILALKLEQRYSKEEILERYLNTIYFGRGAYGVAAAGRTYFGRDVADLALSDVAYLAGLIRSPETADPFAEPLEAAFRRTSVLDAMVVVGAITPDEAADADRQSLEKSVLPRQVHSEMGQVAGATECGTEYFADYVRRLLLDRFGQKVFQRGLRVYTTLDLERQCRGYDVVYREVLDHPNDPAGSLVALDTRGRVIAMVAGRDFRQSQVNLALGEGGGGSGRQPGSLFKTFALAEYLKDGNSLLSKFPAPDNIVIPEADDGKDWEVKGGGNGAAMTLVDATKTSSNTVFAQLMVALGDQGPGRVAELAHSLGVEADLKANPSLVLGTGEVSVLDMATSYSNLSRAGSEVLASVFIDRVDDVDGKPIWNPRRDEEKLRPKPAVLSAEVGAQITSALRQAIDDGTGQRAKLSFDAAGKTGTTEDYRDAWFVGFTCNVTTAVWMGYVGNAEQPLGPMLDVKGVAKVSGGSLPAEIWQRFMSTAASGAEDCSLPKASFGDSAFRIRNAHLSTMPAVGTSSIPATTSTVLPGTTPPANATTTRVSSATTAPTPPSTAATTSRVPVSSTTISTTSTTSSPPTSTTVANPTTTVTTSPTTSVAGSPLP